ncbi:hypothetical protein HFP15_29415 [Amycolatopsis sp. K13G38]|uniref:Lycopene cyclase domain-containing protein n=1 Tax=Amycolatopsis acididurans TaxID=2724524 RepID=A0ABX1JF13_9PSEU|nr:hypothetical protein [Amycolatopsis acididurans]NKQ56995.1 hypothetical protein [Amycolatopsis acididurans]
MYTGPASVAEMLRGHDAVTLVVAIPCLAVSLRAARRGSDRGLPGWAGTLAYLTYTYAFTALATSFNDLFLLHVAVFGGSLFALILTVAAADVAGIAGRFGTRTPRRVVAAILGVLTAGLAGMWIYAVVRYAVTGVSPAGSALVEPDSVTHFGIALDLAVLTPAYALAAVLLWRRAAWGYLLAALALVSGTLQQLSYLVAPPFQAAAHIPGAVPVDPAEPVIVALYLVAGGLLLWNAGRRTADDLG